MDNEIFIKKAKEVHGDKYDYSLSQYHHDRSIRTTIICPIHGPFEQRPKNHLAGRGCRACALIEQGVTVKDRVGEDVITRFREVHGDRYDYTRVNYCGMTKKIDVVCSKHGVFKISSGNHLDGKGCRQCWLESTRTSMDTFLERAVEAHGAKYDYSKVNITESKSKVCIVCPEHGEFKQNYTVHLQGKGCPQCALRGYNTSKPGKLYVLEHEDTTKIGITNREVKKRVSQIKSNSGKKFGIITYFEFDDGAIPLRLESELLQELRAIYEQPSEKYDGSTECFIGVDVINLLDCIKRRATELTT